MSRRTRWPGPLLQRGAIMRNGSSVLPGAPDVLTCAGVLRRNVRQVLRMVYRVRCMVQGRARRIGREEAHESTTLAAGANALAQFVLRAALRPTANAAATVFCASSIGLGSALGAALGLIPLYLAAAIGGTLIAHALARAVRLPDALLADGSLTYNVLLASLAVAWITREVPAGAVTFMALLTVTAAMTLALSAALLQWVPRVAGLPPLSIAFSLVFGSLITLFPDWSAASVLAPPAFWQWPDGLSTLFALLLPQTLTGLATGFLRSLGTVLFLADPFAGLLVAIALVAWSRLALLFAFTGYAGGMIVVAALTHLGVVFHGAAAAHNYLLAGMALGAVYFVPSRGTLLLAAFAGACAALAAAVVQRLLHGSGWEFLPLPFILTVWVTLCALRLRSEPGALVPAAFAARNPEGLWREHARHAARFPQAAQAHLALPSAVEGSCISGARDGTARIFTVTQGFDGALSHRGAWQHALDFEVHDNDGLPHARGSGMRIEDFYTFGVPVCAPGAGTVLRVAMGVADNPPGGCNFAHNWGNHVVLQLDCGTCITLAHFREQGIRVAVGQRVAAGEVLGECGNSGRSPVPHIHLQAQAGANPSAPTVPFRLANYLSYSSAAQSASEMAGAAGVRWVASGVPVTGERVAAVVTDARVQAALAQIVPGRSMFCVSRDGRSAMLETLDCRIDEAGRHVFCNGDGTLTCAAGPQAWEALHCTPGTSQLIGLLGLVLARAPYANAPALWWDDHVDWHAAPATWRGRLVQGLRDLAAPFTGWQGVRVECRYVHDATGSYRTGAASAAGASAAHEARDTHIRIHARVHAPRALHTAALPRAVEVTLEPVRGVTAVRAWFSGGVVDYRLGSFQFKQGEM